MKARLFRILSRDAGVLIVCGLAAALVWYGDSLTTALLVVVITYSTYVAAVTLVQLLSGEKDEDASVALRRVEVNGSQLVARKWSESWDIDLHRIRYIKVAKLGSRWAKISVMLVEERTYLIQENGNWFAALIEALKFDEILGSDWRARVNRGEALEHNGPIP